MMLIPTPQLIKCFKNRRGLETEVWQGGGGEQDEGKYAYIL